MAFSPRIVAFLCEGCSQHAADLAGRERRGYPQALLPIRVPCSGRIDPGLVLRAFRGGAEGVLVAACHPQDCRHGGSSAAEARCAILGRLLEALGIERARLRFEGIGASEAERFAAVARDMAATVSALGPLDYARRALGRDPASPPAEKAPRRRPSRSTHRLPRVAIHWNAACGGCDEAILDEFPDLSGLTERAQLVYWPLAIDGRRADVERLKDGALDLALVSGAVRLQEDAEWAVLLRRKARRLVALGACADTGGVVGLGNLAGAAAIARTARSGAVRASPASAREPAPLLPMALPLSELVPVDAVIPGCPPPPEVLRAALERLLADEVPAYEVLAPPRALCETCPRRATRPERPALVELRRLASHAPDPERCFLDQGHLCHGPATRQGCGGSCIAVNMPCRGCSGAPEGAPEPGAAMIGAVGALLAAGGLESASLAGGLADVAGSFYPYGLAAATLPEALRSEGEEEGGP
ncbi:MAG TPA: hydrogenase iron-sulfur subunit [Anaeromyxobacteraceae bacterium]|jgi:F420-non-reducing hydrogenase small subunit|nr:hydrogenase iron-sulfur subunit [Anaeromyxobacteraceae bacterium]